MSKKRANRPPGHYCKICGEYKANEKFSGKGHAAHICKSCSRLSAAEKAEAMTISRLMDFPMGRLNANDKKCWRIVCMTAARSLHRWQGECAVCTFLKLGDPPRCLDTLVGAIANQERGFHTRQEATVDMLHPSLIFHHNIRIISIRLFARNLHEP